MAKSQLIRILVKGGILTPGYFLKIIEAARKSGNNSLKFGSRQDILFEVNANQKTETEILMQESGIGFEWKGAKSVRKQNIVSTFVTSGILESTTWVTEGDYLKILQEFDYTPRIKVNIVDAKQNLQPLFNGMVNFISSDVKDYWYCYINTNQTLKKAPFLITSLEIPKVSKFCDQIMLNNSEVNAEELIKHIDTELSIKRGQTNNKLDLPKGFFPYYEGIEKMRKGKNYWAGFYWRNNNYSLDFIEKVCKLCLKKGIAKISITPWKTFLIKDIKPEDLSSWEQLIGRMGINMRHSSFELNWHLPIMDNHAFKLKRKIVRSFDKVDVRTFGLTFSITDQTKEGLNTSIKIIKNSKIRIFGKFDPFFYYSIEIAQNFNPNSQVYKVYAQNLARNELPGVLIELSKDYYQSLLLTHEKQSDNKKKTESKKLEIHQCNNCLTVYNESTGDEFSNIKPGTPFNELPEDYCCSLCESPKKEFSLKKISEQLLIIE